MLSDVLNQRLKTIGEEDTLTDCYYLSLTYIISNYQRVISYLQQILHQFLKIWNSLFQGNSDEEWKKSALLMTKFKCRVNSTK